jgi:NAD(P)-dependent dehydrogenase (short-subunit alcohol dehydrogenase family)
MTRQVIEGMRARKFGRVINISSINGQKVSSAGQLFGGQGRRHRLHQGARSKPGRHHGECDLPATSNRMAGGAEGCPEKTSCR